MAKDTYERFGLTGNPFRDLASETIDLVDIFHVDQEIDEELKEILDEISEKENKATIAILGSLGVGKTERLMLISNYAKKKELFYIFRTMTPETKWAVKGMLDHILEEAPLTAFEKFVNAPKWFVEMKKVSKRIQKGKGHDPVNTGKLIAESLNRKSPSFLLINDLQAIPKSKDLSDFMQTLYVVINNIEPGVLVAITSNKYFFDDLMKDNEAFNQRINRKFLIEGLSPKQAEHLIAKRLLARRLTEDLGLVYPFTKDSVKVINDEAMGNPRQVLKIADSIMDHASKAKTVEIGQEHVIDYIRSRKGKEMLPPAPSNVVTEFKARRVIIDRTPEKNIQSNEPQKIDIEKPSVELPNEKYIPPNKDPMDQKGETHPEKDNINQNMRIKELEQRPQFKKDEKIPNQSEVPQQIQTPNLSEVKVVKEETVYKPSRELGLPSLPKPPKNRFERIEAEIDN